MTRLLALAAATMLLSAGAASAQTAAGAQTAACTRPTAPAAVDGVTANIDQMVAYRGAVLAFISASDAYQDCLDTDVAAQKAAAKKAGIPFNAAVAKAADAAADANQADKESVGTTYNAAKKAYTAAHPAG